MINYKEILTLPIDDIKHNYYFLFLINNFILIDNFSSFKESLFDKSDLNEEEKEQLIFILKYLLKTDYILFRVDLNYFERLKDYFYILLKDKQYRKYHKEILMSLVTSKINLQYYKDKEVFPKSLERYISMYSLNENVALSTKLFERIVSSDLIMFNYLFVEQKNLIDIMDTNFETDKALYASSLFHIFTEYEAEYHSSLLKEKINSFLDRYMENETNIQILFLGKKLNILFEKYLSYYNKNNISFFPEPCSKLVYQSEPLNGKVLNFKRKDT